MIADEDVAGENEEDEDGVNLLPAGGGVFVANAQLAAALNLAASGSTNPEPEPEPEPEPPALSGGVSEGVDADGGLSPVTGFLAARQRSGNTDRWGNRQSQLLSSLDLA